jgi:hypothetical protein
VVYYNASCIVYFIIQIVVHIIMGEITTLALNSPNKAVLFHERKIRFSITKKNYQLFDNASHRSVFPRQKGTDTGHKRDM